MIISNNNESLTNGSLEKSTEMVNVKRRSWDKSKKHFGPIL
ncbi:hypothetical protein [Enterococcus sp. BSD2780061688st2 D3]|nr:hypothetical protein [Enterococcus sp. BSD2780061688st2 D3]